MTNEVEKLRTTYSQLSRYMLALLMGAIIFFPAITGALKPPYILDVALYAFWIFAVLGFIFLGTAFYLSSYVKNKVPHKSGGVGNWCALLALLSLVIYVGANIYSDRTNPPTILSVTVEPKTASPGQWVKLVAEAVDEDADRLRWKWVITAPSKGKVATKEEVVGERRIAYWKVPSKVTAKEYMACVEVSDDRSTSTKANVLISVKEKEMNEQRLLKEYIRDRVSLHLGKIARAKKEKSALCEDAQDALLDMALQNITSLDAVKNDPDALTEALDSYFEISEQELGELKFRPCCSKWPGSHPFCDPTC